MLKEGIQDILGIKSLLKKMVNELKQSKTSTADIQSLTYLTIFIYIV